MLRLSFLITTSFVYGASLAYYPTDMECIPTAYRMLNSQTKTRVCPHSHNPSPCTSTFYLFTGTAQDRGDYYEFSDQRGHMIVHKTHEHPFILTFPDGQHQEYGYCKVTPD